MSEFKAFPYKFGDGGVDSSAISLDGLTETVSRAVAAFEADPDKCHGEMMRQEGIYSRDDEFGYVFWLYKEIDRKIQNDLDDELSNQEIDFYEQVWRIFDPLDFLVKEREEVEQFNEKYAETQPHQQAWQSEIPETSALGSDFELDDLVRLSDAFTSDVSSQSPLKALDSLIVDVKNKTLQSLNSSNDNADSDSFFRTFDSNNSNHSQLDDESFPGHMHDSILNASIAIELSLDSHGNFESDEAREACQSYLTALALTEVEQKLMPQHARLDIDEKAEVAAVSTASPLIDGQIEAQPTTQNNEQQSNRQLDFDIQNLSYDISLLPSDDPDNYKPLEIVSYIALTRNHEKN